MTVIANTSSEIVAAELTACTAATTDCGSCD
jgi:hypothetical protein